MTAARQVGALAEIPGITNDSRFVIDAIHCHSVYFSASEASHIFEVDTIRQGRGLTPEIERIIVRVWPLGHETYHSTMRQAIRARVPEQVLSMVADEQAERSRARADMAALEMELC